MVIKDIIGLVIVGVVAMIFIVLAIGMLRGKGAWLIAGYNTADKTEREKYDSVALCKFIGKILLPIGILLPSIAIGGIYEITWLPIAYFVFVVAMAVFAIVYVNVKRSFRK